MCISSQELSEIQSVSMETKFPTFKLVFKSSVKWSSTEDYIIDQRHSAQCKQDQEKKNIQVQVIYLIGTFPICTSGFLSPADQPFFFFFFPEISKQINLQVSNCKVPWGNSVLWVHHAAEDVTNLTRQNPLQAPLPLFIPHCHPECSQKSSPNVTFPLTFTLLCTCGYKYCFKHIPV